MLASERLCLSPDNQRPAFKEIKFSASWTESSSGLDGCLVLLCFNSELVDDCKCCHCATASLSALLQLSMFRFETHSPWNAFACLLTISVLRALKEIKFSASWTESSSGLDGHLVLLCFNSELVDNNKHTCVCSKGLSFPCELD